MEKREKEEPFFWIGDSNEQLSVPIKMKRKVKAKKIEFVGWGSKPLIEFLESMGRDISIKLSQYEVTAIVNEYIHRNGLFHPVKKKRVMCDEWLHYLFGKKWVPRIKIYDLLEAHFAENHDESEDETFFSSEGEDDMVYKKQKVSSSDIKKAQQKIQVPETPKSCFASITSDNMKLVYLKRSLIQDLSKDPESFEVKVVGSYVRIKSDPNDYFQKNSHQLQQVAGVNPASGCADDDREILLQVPNLLKDVHISMLSDDNFSEEECEDLRQRVKAGLANRPTVVELEQKSRILHEDITKHWLVRELVLLQNLIDRANEKGWRRDAFTLFDYLERKQLLQMPSEQSRLLLEVPKVIAEELEPEPTLQECVENVEEKISCSPKPISRVASDVSADLETNQTSSSQISESIVVAGSKDAIIPSQVSFCKSSVGGEGNTFTNGITSVKEEYGKVATFKTHKQDMKTEDRPAELVQQKISSSVVTNGEIQIVKAVENEGTRGMAAKQVTASQVIELSDDEEAEDPDVGKHILEHPDSVIWYYLDPQGDIQGPFSMRALKRWSDANYFQPGFKVWKKGQIPDNSVFLSDMLGRIFRN